MRNAWVCRLSPSSVRAGKKIQPWRGASRAEIPRSSRACFSWKTRKSGSMSGSRSTGIRRGVMAGVLVHPPRVADSHDEIADDPRGEVVGASRFPDLTVRRLVSDEGVLGEQHAEDGGDEELVPAVAKQREADPGRHHEERDEQEGADVEEATAPKQPGIPNRAQQARELGRGVRQAARTPVRTIRTEGETARDATAADEAASAEPGADTSILVTLPLCRDGSRP